MAFPIILVQEIHRFQVMGLDLEGHLPWEVELGSSQVRSIRWVEVGHLGFLVLFLVHPQPLLLLQLPLPSSLQPEMVLPLLQSVQL